MATIVTRAGKGSPLTNTELDSNFSNLNSDKVETSAISTFGGTLIDDADAAAARTTLGLGTAATTASTDYATAAQGSTADSALQDITGESISDLSDVVITTVADNDVIAYDSTTSKYINQSASEAGLATSAQGTLADSAVQPGDNVSDLTNDSGFITGNQTITLSGDVTGSGTTSITATVANDSHSHTGSTLSGIAVSNLDAAAVQTSAEAFADSDTVLMTAAAVADKIESYGYTTQTGDITGVSAGNGLTGGGTSGDVTVNVGAGTGISVAADSVSVSYGTTAGTATQGNDSRVNNGQTAYGWGDHSSAGYITGNQTITLSGDVSGSGTTSIAVTVADDSHNHVISNVDGLQTALDAKAALSGASFTGAVYSTGNMGYDSTDYISWSNNAYMNITINGSNEFRFEADGDFHADGDVIAYSTTTASDERLKDNITVVDDALAKVCALNGVTFKWKKDGSDSAGVIAQEVVNVLPQAVKEVNDLKEGSHLAVNYGALTSILIEAIKELSAEVEALKGAK